MGHGTEKTLEQQPAATLDTMLQPVDIFSEEETQILSFVPAKRNRPLSVFLDKYSEELAFATIFCGEKRKSNCKLSYSDNCTSELRRSDRRVAENIQNIFLNRKNFQAKHIYEKSNLVLRKTKRSSE